MPFTLEIADGYTERDSFIFAQLTEDWDQGGPVPAGDWGIDLGDEEPPF